MSDPHIYVYDCREPVWKSAVRDTMSFGGLIGTAVALNTLMPPSAWLNATLGICWFFWLVGVAQKKTKRMTPDETRTWLSKEYPAQGIETAEPPRREAGLAPEGEHAVTNEVRQTPGSSSNHSIEIEE